MKFLFETSEKTHCISDTVLLLIVLKLLLLCGQPVLAAQAEASEIKPLPEHIVSDFRSKVDYKPSAGRDSLLGRVLNWIRDNTAIDFDTESLLPALRFLAVLMVIAILLYVIFRSQFRSLFRRERVLLQWNQQQSSTSQTQDFDPLAHLEAGKYREAVRATMLDSLRSLHRSGCIKLDINKTNTDYLKEIQNPEINGYFKKISELYVWVWYGGFIPTKSQAEEVITFWQNLKKVRV